MIPLYILKGYSAFKDVAKGVCYVEKSNHTLQDFTNALQNIAKVNLVFYNIQKYCIKHTYTILQANKHIYTL